MPVTKAERSHTHRLGDSLCHLETAIDDACDEIDRLRARQVVLVQALGFVAGDCYLRAISEDVPHCRYCGRHERDSHDRNCTMQVVTAALQNT
jgi:hypothetical protein